MEKLTRLDIFHTWTAYSPLYQKETNILTNLSHNHICKQQLKKSSGWKCSRGSHFRCLWLQVLFATFEPRLKAVSLEELNPQLTGLVAFRGKGFSYPEKPAPPLPPTCLWDFIKVVLFQARRNILSALKYEWSGRVIGVLESTNPADTERGGSSFLPIARTDQQWSDFKSSGHPCSPFTLS